MEPIVDGDMMVVGHVGWINETFLYAPRQPYFAALKAADEAAEKARKSPFAPPREAPLQADVLPFIPLPLAKPEVASAEALRMMTRRLGQAIEADVDIVVAEKGSPPSGYDSIQPFGPADGDSYYVVTGIDGHVIAVLGCRSSSGLIPVAITPLDLIMIPYLAGKAVVLAGRAAIVAGEAAAGMLRMGIRSTLWTLARRNSIRVGSGISRAVSSVFRREVAVTEEMIVGEELTGSVTAEELHAYLARKLELTHLKGLMGAGKTLEGDRLVAKIESALDEWQLTGRGWHYQPRGSVQRLSGRPGNFAHLRGNALLIEEHLKLDPKLLFKEVKHELSADALGWRGRTTSLAYIGENPLLNAQFFLEAAIEEGSLDTVMEPFLRRPTLIRPTRP